MNNLNSKMGHRYILPTDTPYTHCQPTYVWHIPMVTAMLFNAGLCCWYGDLPVSMWIKSCIFNSFTKPHFFTFFKRDILLKSRVELRLVHGVCLSPGGDFFPKWKSGFGHLLTFQGEQWWDTARGLAEVSGSLMQSQDPDANKTGWESS